MQYINQARPRLEVQSDWPFKDPFMWSHLITWIDALLPGSPEKLWGSRARGAIWELLPSPWSSLGPPETPAVIIIRVTFSGSPFLKSHGLWPYLHFVEDELVPQAVVPDDALLHFSKLSLHGKVQQPFLERSFGPTVNLVTSSVTAFKMRNDRCLKAEREGLACPTRITSDEILHLKYCLVEVCKHNQGNAFIVQIPRDICSSIIQH